MSGVGVPWPIGPLLEPGAAAVTGELDDPQIPVLLVGRISVADLGPDYRCRALDSEDLGAQTEDLIRAFSFVLPHPLDRVHASKGLFVRRLQISGVIGEQVRETLSARRPPGGLIACQPSAHC